MNKTGDRFVDEINRLVAKHFPPDKRGWVHISYWGDEQLYSSSPMWLLGGCMTPVGPEYVINELEQKGANVEWLKNELKRRRFEQRAEEERRQRLRESAMAKLTKEESEACGLYSFPAQAVRTHAFPYPAT